MSKQPDRLFNSLVRLTNQLGTMRQTLCELSQVIATKREGDDLPYIASQVKREADTLEWMAQEASKLYEPQASKITMVVSQASLSRPESQVSYSAMVVDSAWRAWNLVNAQFVIHTNDAERLLTGLAKCADRLRNFDEPDEIVKNLLLEHRTVATLRAKQVIPMDREEVPLSTLANELDVSKQSLYRLRDKGHIKPQGEPLFLYRDQIDINELLRLLELQRKQQLRGQ